MTFNFPNFGNHTLENMLPLFGNLTNGLSTSITNHPNFINQLAAMITTTENTNSSNGNISASVINLNPGKNNTTSQRQEPLNVSSLLSPSKSLTKGTVPMDLENDLEQEALAMRPASADEPGPGITSNNPSIPTKLNDKFSLQNANLYLNSLMAAPGYMFFPTNNTTPANVPNNAQAAAAAAANNLLMDQASLMAAAMQQVQQNYAGFSLTSPAPDTTTGLDSNTVATSSNSGNKEIIKTKSCMLFPPNPNAPPPTIRDRPLGCRTVFVGGLPENITEDIIREIFEPCGEITTLRMSKKNFCHIRYRVEKSIDRAIYLSGYRLRINSQSEQACFGRLHVDYAQARDDQYDYECKQRQLQREQRHRERLSMDRMRSQSPPPIPHYTDHEASVISENLRNNETFQKAVQTICIWLERGDCTKRNANVFYTMIQITHGHVRRLHTDKQNLEEALRKTRENYRKQMLTMTSQFTQIEKVFNAASHKKVWDHFTKAQRKNIDQWKKLASDLRSVQIEDDEMEMSDDDRDYQSRSSKRTRYESESLKEENDSLRCQLEAMRNEMSLERTDIKHDSDFREKQIKVLQETIRNMQTQLLQMKMQEQRDAKTIENLECKLKEAGVKQLLLKTKIKETNARLKDKDSCSLSTGLTISDLTDNSTDGHSTEQSPFEKYTDFQLGKLNAFKDKNISIKKEIIDVDGNEGIVDVIEDLYGEDICENHQENDNRSLEDQIVQNDSFDVEKDLFEDDKNENNEIIDDENVETEKEKNSKLENEKSDICESWGANESSNDTNSKPKEIDVEASVCKEIHPLQSLDAKIIALTTAYLVIHPYGATAKSICMYLQSINKTIDLDSKQLVLILKRYENLFEYEILNNLSPKFAKPLTDSELPNTDHYIENEIILKFSGFTKE